ncbi:hypothetical protein, partial [Enterobacter intestinihominis]
AEKRVNGAWCGLRGPPPPAPPPRRRQHISRFTGKRLGHPGFFLKIFNVYLKKLAKQNLKTTPPKNKKK